MSTKPKREKKKILNPFIKQLRISFEDSLIAEPFTVRDVKKLMEVRKIVKDDGKEYAQKSVDSILSNSDINNRKTTNKNTKVLKGRFIDKRRKEYIFLKGEEWDSFWEMMLSNR